MSKYLCALDELVDGAARQFDVDGTKIAVVRIGDSVHAVDDVCTHEDYSLSEGEVWPEDCLIECWKHGSRFSLVDGHPDSLPATRPVEVYPIELVDGGVHVEVGS